MRKSEQYIKLYRRMLLIRFFEERIEHLFVTGVVAGTVHTCVGQEGTAVGVGSVLRRRDLMTSTHRGHGHLIGKGGDPKRMMAEMFGKVTGYSHGRGGSQLMVDHNIGFMGANGIVGGSIPTATGMALHIKQQQEDRVVACFFGDGAVNQGTFHESLNMAGLWKLPVLFLCENNHYSMSTPCGEGSANTDIAAKAEAYAMDGIRIDGNDLLEVRRVVGNKVKEVRSGGGPQLIEMITYRHSGHSRGDQRVYRTREEEKEWKKKDPIRRFRAFLVKEGIISPEQDKDLKKQVKKEVREIEAFAKNSEFPAPSTLMTGVYA